VEAEPWNTLYHYGPLPGLLIGIVGGAIGTVACLVGRWDTWGKAGLFLLLMLLLGPGLAVNTIFKPHWGRPRPNQVDRFGGDHAFLRVGEPGWNSQLKSFPSGHASMGFYLFAPAFLFFRRQPRLALAFLLLGLLAGAGLGVTRVVQGRHFPSDVLWSAGMVYYSGLLAYLLLGLWRMGDAWRIWPIAAAGRPAASPEIFSIEQARRERQRDREEPPEAERRKTA
jgi:membrane-associated PAP2 superfamily phosphatase